MSTKLLDEFLGYVKAKDIKNSIALGKKILEAEEDNFSVLSVLGSIYYDSKKYDLAEAFLKRAVAIKETNMLVKLLAFTYFELKYYKESTKYFSKVLVFDDSLEIKKKCIKAMILSASDYDYALDFALDYYNQRPFELDNIVDLSYIYLHLGMYEESIDLCKKAMRISLKDGRVWLLNGLIYETYFFDSEEAVKCYRRASRYGKRLEAQYNLCMCYSRVNRRCAIEIGRKLLKEKDFIRKCDVCHTIGTNYFYLRNLKTGYKYYKHSWDNEDKCFKNLWDGTPHLDSILYLHLTSGFGDQFMFLRYLPIVCKYFKKVIIPCTQSVIDLFQTSFSYLKNAEFFIYENYDFEYDYSTSINVLQYVLNSDFYHIPYSEGYLSCSNNKIQQYREKYFDNSLLKIGLCWQAGGQSLRWYRNRSISFDAISNFKNIDGIQLYSMQKDIKPEDKTSLEKMGIVDLGSTFNDFTDTASAIKNLDVLITVDTSVAHLAGALGVKTFLLLHNWADWRWFDNTEKTEWYDSVDIFKQEDDFSWSGVIDRVCENIQVIVDNRSKK